MNACRLPLHRCVNLVNPVRHMAIYNAKKARPLFIRDDIVDGRMLKKGEKLRFSYKGKEKYEYDVPGAIRPHFGQFERTEGDALGRQDRVAYRVSVRHPNRVLNRDVRTVREHMVVNHDPEKLKEMEEMNKLRRHFPTSFISPLVYEAMSQIALTRFGGVHNAFDIILETFELIKLYQLKMLRKKPGSDVELDCNKIFQQAVANVSPPFILRFKQVILTKDGFKPCPVALSSTDSTVMGIKTLKKASLPVRHRRPVDAKMLAQNVLDAYYRRGPIYAQLTKDIEHGLEFKSMYFLFGPYRRKRPKARDDRSHLLVPNVVLPLENADYGVLPGLKEWSVDDLLDEVDKR